MDIRFGPKNKNRRGLRMPMAGCALSTPKVATIGNGRASDSKKHGIESGFGNELSSVIVSEMLCGLFETPAGARHAALGSRYADGAPADPAAGAPALPPAPPLSELNPLSKFEPSEEAPQPIASKPTSSDVNQLEVQSRALSEPCIAPTFTRALQRCKPNA